MKRILLVSMMMTASAFALERKELMPLIEEAAVATSNAYLNVRGKILEYGADALPLLAEIAVDESLPWQQQLVARICYERIERKKDIEKILATDWYRHPKFDPAWNKLIFGPEPCMGAIITPELKDAGLWYYCLEVLWKTTREYGTVGKQDDLWDKDCTFAVKDSPEERVWFLRVCAEILADTPPHPTPPPPRLYWLHNILFGDEKPDAAPLLLQALQLREIKEDSSRFVRKILGYADSRSTDALEKLIASRPKQEADELAPQIIAVRARVAPPSPEPPFRLGTNIVKRAKQP